MGDEERMRKILGVGGDRLLMFTLPPPLNVYGYEKGSSLMQTLDTLDKIGLSLSLFLGNSAVSN